MHRQNRAAVESRPARPLRHPVNTDFPALTAIGWPTCLPGDWADALLRHPDARPARVVAQHRSGYVVAESGEQSHPAQSLPHWLRKQCPPLHRPAVGDWVLVRSHAPHLAIVALLPRYSLIKRAAAGEHYRQQLIAANIDTAFVVTGLDADFNPRRIERYLLLLQGGGVRPVVVLTKHDLHDAAAARQALATLAAQQVPLVQLDARSEASIPLLQPWLQNGQTVALVGSSGAGKSTLANTLLGQARMKTGAVRAHDARGRHTTTHRALIPLPQGACLVDTPGMRELKPTGEETLAEAAFEDIDLLAQQCRFRDCQHHKEPGCAVQEAVQQGVLEAARLASYQKLRHELQQAARVLAQRQTAPPRPGHKPRKLPH